MSDQTQKYIDEITTIAQMLSYNVTTKQYSNATRILCQDSPIVIAIDFFHEDNMVSMWSYVRTSSWEFEGERTDLHETISTVLAAFLRIFPCHISSSLWVVPHPAIDIKSEIYARDILFNQPSYSICSLTQLDIEIFKKILFCVKMFWYRFWDRFDWPLCDCDLHRSRIPPFLYSNQAAKEWGKAVADAIGEEYKADGVQFNARNNPTWKHYRSTNSKISTLFAPEVAKNLAQLIKHRNAWETLDGINGKLFISDEVHNIISFKNLQLAQRILKKLEGSNDQGNAMLTVPLENLFVAIGDSHLLFIERDCGKKRFEQERERIRKRHLQELQLLFPVTCFVWNESVDGDEFELLIRKLLSRERGVKWIRKISIGSEPDNGRDLIVEWQTPPLPSQLLKEDQNPYVSRCIIVQCKAHKRGVGKAEVIDIRDTIEHYNAQGYFLVVSSYLTTPLTEHLEKLRSRGKYWVDWWTRSEIEDRLRNYPDIAARFPNVVKVQK